MPKLTLLRGHMRGAAIAAGALAALAAIIFFPPADRAIGGLLAASDDGAAIASYPDRLHREAGKHHSSYVDYAQIPPCLNQAIVSVEDKRFFSHGGVDPIALLRVLAQDAMNDHVDHGGSTITLQLARMILHIPRRQPSALGKAASELRIVRAGLMAEHDFNKQRILELYLNGVYLGRRATGIAAAAQAYFQRPLQQLNPAQCIYMAGLPNDPTLFGADPAGARAIARYHHVIATMQRNGYLTDTQAVALADGQLFS